jgi:hypothetical protein
MQNFISTQIMVFLKNIFKGFLKKKKFFSMDEFFIHPLIDQCKGKCKKCVELLIEK